MGKHNEGVEEHGADVPVHMLRCDDVIAGPDGIESHGLSLGRDGTQVIESDLTSILGQAYSEPHPFHHYRLSITAFFGAWLPRLP